MAFWRFTVSRGTKHLWMGALKSAISQITGVVVGLQVVNIHDWRKTVGMIISVLVIAEARFWKQWADSVTAGPDDDEPPMPPAAVVKVT